MRKVVLAIVASVMAIPAMADPWPYNSAQPPGYGEQRREHMDHGWRGRERAIERERCLYHHRHHPEECY